MARLLPIVALQRRVQYDRWARRWLLRWMADYPHESIEPVAEVAAVLQDMGDRPGSAASLREHVERRCGRHRR